jgi:hypothetical protein
MAIDLTTLSEEELIELNHRIIERLQLVRSARSLTTRPVLRRYGRGI